MVLTEFSRYSYLLGKPLAPCMSPTVYLPKKLGLIFSSSSKASGAYVFRPNGTFPIEPKAQVCSLLYGIPQLQIADN